MREPRPGVLDVLRLRLGAAFGDPELARLTPGLTVSVASIADVRRICFVAEDRHLRWDEHGDAHPDIAIEAASEAWGAALSSPPPPTFHAFTALCLANPAFRVGGDPVTVARARPLLERLFERLAAVPPAPAAALERSMAAVTGRYHAVWIGGRHHDVYAEWAGDGPTVVFLHTAGADSRQFHGQLSDLGMAAACRMVAFDLPFHGRSFPPREWDGGPHRLTTEVYRSWCAAFIEQVAGVPAVVVGGSMGAAMALVLAADRPDLVRGVVAVEPPFRSKGRINPYQHHVACTRACTTRPSYATS